MPSLSVIRLGPVDGFVMTNAFVALAESVSRGERGDTLVICHPSAPFANAGVHQEVDREIDIDYCRSKSVPVIRRVIGGGAIADGPWEQDYFLITPLGSAATAGTLKDYYGRMLEPISASLKRLGIDAERQGLNDLAVGGRKISANGAVDIDGARVLTGDILLDLNVGMMSGILKVPDEKFRGKVADSMSRYLTSVREQTGREADRENVISCLVGEFAGAYGDSCSEGSLTEIENERIDELVDERSSEAWIFERSASSARMSDRMRRVVKIREGMFLCAHDLKAQKLVRITMLVDDGRIAEITISGDFFTVPVSWPVTRLEKRLAGLPLEERAIRGAIREVLDEDSVTLLGAGADDIASAILEAVAHPVIVPPG